jgi:hypothetical protein
MAQHSYCVYHPASHFYQRNHNNSSQNNNVSSQNQIKSSPVVGSPAASQSQAMRFQVLSSIPFLNRNGKLHKSNPHLHFGRHANEEQKGAHLPSRPNIQRSQKKLKNSSNNNPSTPSILHRRFCDFVLRRNEDNQVYRSESFRFIQKTDSLQLLPHLSVGLNKYRKKQLQVSNNLIKK